MNFVVWNPPYVRVHNLKKDSGFRNFAFAQRWMTDLYLVFFEIGFAMLADKWSMCLITPNSWLSSNAWWILRDVLIQEKILNGLIDLWHFQPFNATTYTIISRFKKWKKSDYIDYYIYDGILHYQDTVMFQDICHQNKFYIGKKSDLAFLKKIIESCLLLRSYYQIN